MPPQTRPAYSSLQKLLSSQSRKEDLTPTGLGLPEAAKLAERAVSLSPKDPSNHYTWGIVYSQGLYMKTNQDKYAELAISAFRSEMMFSNPRSDEHCATRVVMVSLAHLLGSFSPHKLGKEDALNFLFGLLGARLALGWFLWRGAVLFYRVVVGMVSKGSGKLLGSLRAGVFLRR